MSRASGAEAEVADLDGATAPAADHVVVMGRTARHVGVLAGRQVDPLEGPASCEELDRAEDRRSADPQPPASRVGDQVGRRERPVAGLDQLDQGAPGPGQPVTGRFERDLERGQGRTSR